MHARRSGGPRTTIRRQRQKANYDRTTIDAIIDASPWCHLAVTVEGVAMAIPTFGVRDGDTLLIHGARGSSALGSARAADLVSCTFTIIDGLLVATTGFEHSVAFRSVVVVGQPSVLSGADKVRALDLLVDGVIPGRSAEIPRPTRQELNATVVLAVSLDECVAKVSVGPPDATQPSDGPPIWAGVVPITSALGVPQSFDPTIPIPPSIIALTEEQR